MTFKTFKGSKTWRMGKRSGPKQDKLSQSIRLRITATIRWPHTKQGTVSNEVGLQNQRGYHIALTKYEAVRPKIVSEKKNPQQGCS